MSIFRHGSGDQAVTEVVLVAFEVFTKKLTTLGNQPYVTLQRRGTISMNKAAHHLMGDPDAVELLYDVEAQVMGFRAVEETVEHAYAIRSMGGQKKESSTYMVSGTAFFKHYDIDISVARRYAATLKNGVLCLDLSTPGTEVTGNRAGTGKNSSAAETGTLFDSEIGSNASDEVADRSP